MKEKSKGKTEDPIGKNKGDKFEKLAEIEEESEDSFVYEEGVVANIDGPDGSLEAAVLDNRTASILPGSSSYPVKNLFTLTNNKNPFNRVIWPHRGCISGRNNDVSSAL